MVPPAPRTRVSTTGRTIPSSHSHHSPTMRINSRSWLRMDVLTEGTIVFGMCRFGLCPGELGRVGDKGFLPGHGDKLASGLRQQFGPVGAQPIAIRAESCKLRPRPGDFGRVGDFFDNELGFVHSWFGS